jgi:hypothetical protein
MQFSGQASTVKCFENNPLVRKVSCLPHQSAGFLLRVQLRGLSAACSVVLLPGCNLASAIALEEPAHSMPIEAADDDSANTHVRHMSRPVSRVSLGVPPAGL